MSIHPDISLDTRRAHRLSIVLYANRYLSQNNIRGIAEYLQVPPQALINSVHHHEAHGSWRPVQFKVMTRMNLPSLSERFMMGVAILPTYLQEGRRVTGAYQAPLNALIDNVVNERPPLENIPQDPVRVAQDLILETKAMVDALHTYPGTDNRKLTIHITDGVCAAYYQSLKTPP
jgi:hypothetical protein